MTIYKWIPSLLCGLFYCVNRSYAACAGAVACDCQQPDVNKLPIVNCRNRQLTDVPLFVVGSDHFSQVDLSGNQIRTIKSSAFDIFNEITNIDLSENPIEKVENSAFYGVESTLKVLLIHLAPNTAFPATALAGLVVLNVLEVSGYSSESLPTSALRNLIQLQELRLINGQLKQLTKDDLIGQQNALQTLNLQGNLISNSAAVDISALTQLRSLILASNYLTALPANAFNGAVLLESLDLSNNGLAGNVNVDAFKAINLTLKVLTLTSTQFTDQSLQSLKSLGMMTELYVTLNSIANIPAGLFSATKSLRKIYLSNNKISSLGKESFDGLAASLLTLHLGENPISNLAEDTFTGLTSLSELDLEGTKNLKLTDSIFKSQKVSLKILNLADMGIGNQVWSTITSLSGLTTLDLSNNAITQIPDEAFRGNDQLRKLDLSSNQISVLVPKTFNGLQTNLIAVNLGNNQLSTVDRCVFNKFRIFDYFQLGLAGNGLKCDCQLFWLYQYLKSTDPNKFATLSWKCATPNKLFIQMTEAEFGCSSNTTQKPCQDLQIPSSEQPEPLTLTIVNYTDTTAVLVWSVKGAGNIESFQVSYAAQDKEDTTEVMVLVAGYIRTYTLAGLLPLTSYQICVNMTTTSSWILAKQSCGSLKTLASNTKTSSGSGQDLAIILGSALGGIALVVIIIVVCIVCLQRHRKEKERVRAFRKSKETPRASDIQISSISDGKFPESRAEASQMGYGSRRYIKNPRGHPFSNHPSDTPPTHINKPTKHDDSKPVEIFSSEEQDRILHMLTSAPMSRHKSQSTSSVGSNPRYVMEPHRTGVALNSPNVHMYTNQSFTPSPTQPNQRTSNIYNEINNAYEEDFERTPYSTTV